MQMIFDKLFLLLLAGAEEFPWLIQLSLLFLLVFFASERIKHAVRCIFTMAINHISGLGIPNLLGGEGP